MTQALARAGPRHNYNVELVYRRRTGRACSLFQRLALPQGIAPATVPSRWRPWRYSNRRSVRTIPFGVLPLDPRVLL